MVSRGEVSRFRMRCSHTSSLVLYKQQTHAHLLCKHAIQRNPDCNQSKDLTVHAYAVKMVAAECCQMQSYADVLTSLLHPVLAPHPGL